MNIDPACIFCRIITGELPSHKVHEDDLFLAFLDIAPMDEGHTVLVPKTHVNDILTLPAEYEAALGSVISRLGARLIQATGTASLNVLSNIGARAGQVVHHAHLHMIPRYPGDDSLNWTPGESSQEKLAELARQIRGY